MALTKDEERRVAALELAIKASATVQPSGTTQGAIENMAARCYEWLIHGSFNPPAENVTPEDTSG